MNKDYHEELAERTLQTMSLGEKVGQVCQLDGRRDDIELWIRDRGLGSVLHVTGERLSWLTRLAEQESRLGIPLLAAIDAIHGHAFYDGATVFPSQLAMGATWNSQLVAQVGKVTAAEVRSTGIQMTFSPVLDLGRDPRWGRTGETFGEDPVLVAVLGSALIGGYQGTAGDEQRGIAACAKHFAGYSASDGARDSDEVRISRRQLETAFFHPFESAVRSGVAAVMAGYHAFDGVPCSANRWLLIETLQDKWGFDGVVITDWDNVGRMVREQYVAATMEDAAVRALTAGNHLIMATPEFYDAAIAAVEAGKIPVRTLDEAVRRVLLLKARLGLFDGKCDSSGGVSLRTTEALELAEQAATESIVLCKNDGVLPSSPEADRIAVVGSHASDRIAQLGDWSFGPRGSGYPEHMEYHQSTTTVAEGIKAVFGVARTVISASDSIPDALEASQDSDVVVLVVGDWIDEIGEMHDRADLQLRPSQRALFRALADAPIRLITVVIASKPLLIGEVLAASNAVLYAFNPGLQGGLAVANILAGVANPSARLPVTFPRHVGQLPVFYYGERGGHSSRYCDLQEGPLLPFGFGLSYTKFLYQDLNLSVVSASAGDIVSVSVRIANQGDRPGAETAQLYIQDLVSSVTTPRKMLKGFRKVLIEAHSTELIVFDLPIDELSIVDSVGNRCVEPGQFRVMVGSSSRDEDLLMADLFVE